jgi:hypothetical protein
VNPYEPVPGMTSRAELLAWARVRLPLRDQIFAGPEIDRNASAARRDCMGRSTNV